MVKYYSGQLVAMAGMLGELILNGVTKWFNVFTELFILLGIVNFMLEIKDGTNDTNQVMKKEKSEQ